MNIALQRVCGGCTACCKTHAVYEIEKPVGKWCPHCEPSRECRIYADRPKGCRGFRCEWLKGFGEEDDRPDKSGLVLDYISFRPLIPRLFQIWESRGGALREAGVKELIDLSLRNCIPVVLFYSSGKREFFSGGMELSKEVEQAMRREKVKIL
ncbi:MAG: hypothetical protein UV34_C0009G0037 [Parcubacteria group bacterium GW2011_GWB1_42_6]|nr:MAG: hypothetical protein UV34_C0009G0037 [Parcubacteria group bacterium GW2011_GWB1_42_6]